MYVKVAEPKGKKKSTYTQTMLNGVKLPYAIIGLASPHFSQRAINRVLQEGERVSTYNLAA